MPNITITLSQIQLDVLEHDTGKVASAAVEDVVQEVVKRILSNLRGTRRSELVGQFVTDHADLKDATLIAHFKAQ